jgi:hypothetical protein
VEQKEESVSRAKKSKRYLSISGLLLAMSLALGLLVGCSSNSTAPVPDNPNDPNVTWQDASELDGNPSK